jgi:hypothetical protein
MAILTPSEPLRKSEYSAVAIISPVMLPMSTVPISSRSTEILMHFALGYEQHNIYCYYLIPKVAH